MIREKELSQAAQVVEGGAMHASIMVIVVVVVVVVAVAVVVVVVVVVVVGVMQQAHSSHKDISLVLSCSNWYK